MADQGDRDSMLNRGGVAVPASFNRPWAEEQYAAETPNDLAPERVYERRWALTVLDYSIQILAGEYASQGKADVFQAMRPFLGYGAESEERYEEVSRQMSVPAGTLQSLVYRLRVRWRELLFDQVSFTLADPTQENIKDELKELLTRV